MHVHWGKHGVSVARLIIDVREVSCHISVSYVNEPFIGMNKHLCHTCTHFSRISVSGKILQKDAWMTWNAGTLRASVTGSLLTPTTLPCNDCAFFKFAFMLIWKKNCVCLVCEFPNRNFPFWVLTKSVFFIFSTSLSFPTPWMHPYF